MQESDNIKYYDDYDSENFNEVLNKYEFMEMKQTISPILPRQMLVRNMISLNTLYESILLYWSVGSGKTIGAISIAEGFKEYLHDMGRKIIVLVKNANIENNFVNELLKYDYLNYITKEERAILEDKKSDSDEKETIRRSIRKRIRQTYTFYTYGIFHKHVKSREIADLNDTVLIIDEAHNIAGSDVYVSLSRVLQKSYNYRLVLLTATPIYDNAKQIFEISNLLNMNHKEHLIPIDSSLFAGKDNQSPLLKKQSTESESIFKGQVIEMTEYGKQKLRESLKGKISYLSIENEENINLPEKIEMGEKIENSDIYIVPCEMSDFQYSHYKKAMDEDMIHHISFYDNSRHASTFVYPNGEYGPEGFKQYFNLVGKQFSIKREYQNILTTDLKKFSTKLYHMLENIKKCEGNVYIFSRYVNYAGIELVKQVLKANGFTEKINEANSFQLYDETKTPNARNRILNIFNSVENKHGEKIKIIIGSMISAEGITFKNVRQVHILEPRWNMSSLDQIIGRAVRHNSHMNLPIEERTVEIYKYCATYKDQLCVDKEQYKLIYDKHQANKKVDIILKQSAIDCYLSNEEVCDIKKTTTNVDKSTYNLYIDFFDKYGIEYCINKIKELFNDYYIWSFDDIVNYIVSDEKYMTIESIIKALDTIVQNKMTLKNDVGREGFLVHSGQLYIFNPYDIPINSSIYTKTLDYSEKHNLYTLSEFVQMQGDLDQDILVTKEKEKDVSQDKVELSENDIKYNEDIIKRFNDKEIKLYGSYRKGVKNGFGDVDGKFRIIENIISVSSADEEDSRLIKTGKVGTCYKKEELFQIIADANIPHDNYNEKEFEKLKIKQLVSIIEKYVKQQHLLLK